MTRSTLRIILATAVTLLGACASSPHESVGPEAAPAVWSSELTKDQQVAFMRRNVVPNMAPVFQGHDSTRYAHFGCVTCHGPNNKKPHDFLPRLTVKDGMPTAFSEKPEIAKFMASEVVPKMAAALGVAPFDLATKQGFGCAGCHAIDVK